MNIEELTIGQAKELASIFGGMKASKDGLDDFANGKTVIIRTYSAGVWFGNLALKAGNEVILENARRCGNSGARSPSACPAWYATESFTKKAKSPLR